MTLRLAWFATGSGTTSRKLLSAALDAIGSGHLDAKIVVVFCNKEAGEDHGSDLFCEDVTAARLPLVRFSDRRFRIERGGKPARKGQPLPEWRREYDREVIQLLADRKFDIGVLAGYKLIFCEEAAAQWDLLNLHPAAPGGPAGIWQDVIWQLIDAGAERAGVMMHLATPVLDEGPVVSYCTYAIRGPGFDEAWAGNEAWETEKGRRDEESPLFQAIRSAGVAHEVPLVIETLRALASGRVRIEDKRVVDAAGEEIAGCNLSTQIEAAWP
jgi:folate-dependent phosphoribosylglycinamide formyltransferase PurN